MIYFFCSQFTPFFCDLISRPQNGIQKFIIPIGLHGSRIYSLRYERVPLWSGPYSPPWKRAEHVRNFESLLIKILNFVLLSLVNKSDHLPMRLLLELIWRWKPERRPVWQSFLGLGYRPPPRAQQPSYWTFFIISNDFLNHSNIYRQCSFEAKAPVLAFSGEVSLRNIRSHTPPPPLDDPRNNTHMHLKRINVEYWNEIPLKQNIKFSRVSMPLWWKALTHQFLRIGNGFEVSEVFVGLICWPYPCEQLKAMNIH